MASKTGILLAVVVVAGYFGLEIFAARRAAHRMEPLYIFDQWVSANRAVELCRNPEADRRARFDENMVAVARYAHVELAEQNPGVPADEITRLLEARRIEGRSEVDALLSQESCSGREIWRLARHFEIYANKRVR